MLSLIVILCLLGCWSLTGWKAEIDTSFTHAYVFKVSNQPVMVMLLDWKNQNLLAMTCSLFSPLENAAICERWHCKNIHCVSYALNLWGTSCLSCPSHLLTLGNLGKTWNFFYFFIRAALVWAPVWALVLKVRRGRGILLAQQESSQEIDKCPELNMRVSGILTACLILWSLSKLKTSRRRVGFPRNRMFSQQ